MSRQPRSHSNRQEHNRQEERRDVQRLVMSAVAAVICLILAYLSYRDQNAWQIPVWVTLGVTLVAVPLLPQTKGNPRLVKLSRWIVAAVAIGMFVFELVRRRYS